MHLLDPWWNPATEDQAMERVHRIGQQRPVDVWRYVATDSIEERMLVLQVRPPTASAVLACRPSSVVSLPCGFVWAAHSAFVWLKHGCPSCVLIGMRHLRHGTLVHPQHGMFLGMSTCVAHAGIPPQAVSLTCASDLRIPCMKARGAA